MHLYPLVFLYRRIMFMCVTVLLLDLPDMQMIANTVLSLLMTVYLAQDPMFQASTGLRFVEVGSEFIYLAACVCIQ